MNATLTTMPVPPTAAEGWHQPRTNAPVAGGDADRDGALDALRSIALVRVILWHTFGLAAITYFVSAVPAMFFVTGSLLAKSLSHRRLRTVLLDRARRILLPLWVFAAIVTVLMAGASVLHPSAVTRVPWRGIVLWFLPVADPRGSAWEGGYLGSPLWYLRALLWLLALTPALLWLFRRRPALAFAAPVVTVFALDWVGRHPGWHLPALPDLVWQAGDVALYAVFLLLGFAHHDGRLRAVRPRRWLALAGLAGLAAGGWILTQPVPGNVVNNSHPAHLLVGLAWLCVALAAYRGLARLAAGRVTGPAIAWMSQRTMTIYLWHAAGIVTTRLALRRTTGTLPPGVWNLALLVGIIAVVSVAVVAFGWVEDLAGRRAPRLWPSTLRPGPSRSASPSPGVLRLAGAPAAGLAVLLLATLAPGAVGVGRASAPPRVPSQAPPRPRFEETSAVAVRDRLPLFTRNDDGSLSAPERLAPDAPPGVAAELQAVLERWVADQGAPGAAVGLLLPGRLTWTGGVGRDPYTDAAVVPGSRFELTSATKSFTAALVFQLADEGLIDLEAPLPVLDAVPSFPYGQAVTAGQLLAHRTGLVNYRDTPEWQADAAAMDTAEEAVAAAGRRPLRYTPGTRTDYSSTNYLVLGFLIEQVTGRSFDDLLESRLLGPVGLGRTTHRPGGPAAPNFSTSGIVSDVHDLLRWTTALYRDHVVVPASAVAAMADIEPNTALGAGSVGMCPCTVTPEGRHEWTAIGYTGSTTDLQYTAVDDDVFVLNVTDDLWSPGRFDAVQELAARLRAVAAAHTG